MTRPEITRTRDLTFSNWIRRNLPNSETGFSVSDVDFMLWNWQRREVMFVEVKTHGKELSTGQRRQFWRMHDWVTKGTAETGWNYKGWVIVTFENTSFEDGKCYISSINMTQPIEVTEARLIELLSF